MTIEFKKTLTVQSYETTKLLAHESIVRSDGGEEDTWRDATPSDLASALAAMGEGERAEVLEHFRPALVAYCNESIARAEAAERERDRMAGEFGTCPGELPDDGEIARVVRERAEFRARAEKAERERVKTCLDLERARASLDVVRHDLAGTRAELQEAREARDRSTRLRDAMMPDTRAALDAEQYEDALTAARRVVAERDSLRSRLIAAETAAAQREPREYPLAVGSEWEGDRVVSRWDSAIAEIIAAPDRASVQLLKLQWGPWQIGIDLADVLALAHRRGML